MSWRRFCVLLGGLSPRSRFAAVVAQAGPKPGERVIDDDDEIDQFVASYGVG